MGAITRAGNPGACACHFAPAHCAGAWRPTRRINRDLSCPTMRARGPAQARSAQSEESIAISLPSARALRRTLPSRTEPRRDDPMSHFESHRAHPSTLLSSMLRRGLTTWRSAANAPDGSQDVMTIDGAFVCCNGLLASSTFMLAARPTPSDVIHHHRHGSRE